LRIRYSRWDGSQSVPDLDADADEILSAISELEVFAPWGDGVKGWRGSAEAADRPGGERGGLADRGGAA
jgi:hypothetical protein